MAGESNGVLKPPEGGMLTLATQATDARHGITGPRPLAFPSWLGGLLGSLALLAGVPVAVVAALPTAGLAVPAWLATMAIVGGAVSPVFTGLAFWAQGGNPLELVARRPEGK